MYVSETTAGPVPTAIEVTGGLHYAAKNLSPDSRVFLAADVETRAAADLLDGPSWPLEPGETSPRFAVNGPGHRLWCWTAGDTARVVLTYD